MVVKQARWLAILSLVLGVVLGAIRVWLYLQTGAFDPTSVLVLVLLAIGVLGLIVPAMVYRGGVLEMRNLVGMTMQRYGLAELSVERGGGKPALYGQRPGKRRRKLLAAPPMLHDRRQAAALIDRIEAEKGA